MLAIAGGKGGCGKTTTALGVGAALPGKQVVVDADWDLPNLHRLAETYLSGTDIPRPKTMPHAGATDAGGADASAADAGAADDKQRIELAELADTVELADLGNVRVVPAPVMASEHDVTRLLRHVRNDTESHVLVDCPAGASPDATDPLSVADATLLVTTPHPAAIRDTMKTAAMARILDADPLGVVVSGAAAPPNRIEEALETAVLGCVPRVSPPVLTRPAATSAYRSIASRISDARQTKRSNR